MDIQINESAGAYLGIAMLTWLVAFCVLMAGALLRRRILSWDDSWRQDMEANGKPIREYAKDLEATLLRIRSTSRILGGVLVGLLVIMGFILFLSMAQRPALAMPYAANALWLLSLVALAVVLPAYVSFSVGRNLSETMLLKANVFIHSEEADAMREKVARARAIKVARRLQAERKAMQFGVAPAKPAAAAPAPEKAPAKK